MKCLVCFAVILCVVCSVTNALYLRRDRGELGKEFWGKNHTVMEGDNLTLLCHSQPKAGKQATAYRWQISERYIGGKKYSRRILIYMNSYKKLFDYGAYGIQSISIPGTRDMMIPNIGRYATGTYTCSVGTLIQKRPKRKFYAEFTFQNVLVKCKPKIESKKQTKIHLEAGKKLSLHCLSSGYPTPVITWSRVDGRPLPARTFTHHRGLLSIHRAGQLDRGKYKCVSSNIYGNDSRIFTVNITVPPEILTPSNDKSFATIGKDGRVKCVVSGIPRPKITWKWTDSSIDWSLTSNDGPAGRFRVVDKHYFENSTSSLMINNVRHVDLREYKCVVRNGKDIDLQAIRLVGFSKPDRPIIVQKTSGSTSITLTWKHGESNGGTPITTAFVEYRPENGTQWQRETIDDPLTVQHTIKNLKPDTRYTLRVITENAINYSQPSDTVKINTTKKIIKTKLDTEVFSVAKNNRQRAEGSVDMLVMIIGVAGGFLILIIAIVIVCILMRNMQRNSAKKAAENVERLAKSTNPDATTALINFLQHGGDRLSTTTGSGGGVGNSGEALQLTTSNKWEFPRERLVLQNVLGSGAFGIVMKAEAEGINGYNSGTTPVAVKFVKENESASAKKDLIAELELLKLIEPHKNVINLLGCCTRSEPLMVIVEFCAYGDLQSFLRSSRGIRDQYYLDCYKRPSSRLTSKELLMFGTQIARGMAHLACLKVIHRDLAARNILVDENKVCKVSDFGFARDIYVEDHYTRKTAGGRFPIKWMAIESLLDGISTTKSDVWSFAIVLWEIITLGASPYPGMNSQEVVSFLQNGMRMDKPKHCSDELYNLLLDCWQVAAHRRPNFEMLARYLDRMCNDDFEYINMRTYDDHLYINFDGNTVSEGSSSATLMKQETSSKDSQDNSEESVAEKDLN